MFIGLGVSVNARVIGGGSSPPPSGADNFIPLGSTGMITSDGSIFKVGAAPPLVFNAFIPLGSTAMIMADGTTFKVKE